MGIKFFTKNSQSGDGNPVYEAKQILNSGHNGDIYLLPDGAGPINRFTVWLYADTGSGYIKITNSPRNEVKRGNGIWDNCSLGTVTNTRDSVVISPVTGIRVIRNNGTVIMEVTAQ